MNDSVIEYRGVDLLKLFFCISIVFLHTNVCAYFPNYIAYMIEKGVFRLAVPYFFIASGFFLMKKIDNSSDAVGGCLEYSKKLLIPYLFWEAINCFQVIGEMISKHDVSNLPTRILKNLLFNPYGALWYVWASIIVGILIIPFAAKREIKCALFIAIPLYMVGLLTNSYYFLGNRFGLKRVIDWYLSVFQTGRNAIFVGFPFIVIGMLCYKKRECLQRHKSWFWYCLLPAYAVYMIEVFIVHSFRDSADDAAYYVFLVPVVLLIFLISITYDFNFIERPRLLRRYSVGIYYVHMSALWWIKKYTTSCLMQCIVVLLCSCAVCAIVYRTKNCFFNRVF